MPKPARKYKTMLHWRKKFSKKFKMADSGFLWKYFAKYLHTVLSHTTVERTIRGIELPLLCLFCTWSFCLTCVPTPMWWCLPSDSDLPNVNTFLHRKNYVKLLGAQKHSIEQKSRVAYWIKKSLFLQFESIGART